MTELATAILMAFVRWMLPVGLVGAALIYCAGVVYQFYRQDLPGILQRQQCAIIERIQKLPE
ncbi:hypothetical protein BF49_5609 [Bradyrhizobium sp.]|nr:hypothetical protein BF49_5609 [Bradyrhizobium sp.]